MRRSTVRWHRVASMAGMDMSAREFGDLFNAVSNWGRWDDDGRRGALNHLTPAHTAAAARLVQSGITITLSQPLRTQAGSMCQSPPTTT